MPRLATDPIDPRVVIGPREVLTRYCHQPWPDVVAAAEHGLDGLAVTRAGGQFSRSAPTDHFALRQIQSLSLGTLTGLLEQNW